MDSGVFVPHITRSSIVKKRALNQNKKQT